jgi:hypothetical protein
MSTFEEEVANLPAKKEEEQDIMPLENRPEANVSNARYSFEGASTLILTKEEEEKLTQPVNEDWVNIRPDGLIYLPQTFYRKILNTTLGIGQWAVIENATYRDKNMDIVYFDGSLFIRGKFVSKAVGEARYIEENDRMSWGSVYESAKSDCITRLCKDLGIASELWQPRFIEQWKKKYAVAVRVTLKNGKKVVYWRRKDAEPFYGEEEIISKEPKESKVDNSKILESLRELYKLLISGSLPEGEALNITSAIVEDPTKVFQTVEDLKQMPRNQYDISEPIRANISSILTTLAKKLEKK